MQSGLTRMRPARSVSAPDCAASIPASGEAATPAAQIRVRQRMVSTPSGPFTVTESSSIPTASELRWISTPIPSSWRWV